MMDLEKTKMAMTGLEIGPELRESIWKEHRGDLLGKGIYHIDGGFNRSSIIQKGGGVLKVGPNVYAPLYAKAA